MAKLPALPGVSVIMDVEDAVSTGLVPPWNITWFSSLSQPVIANTTSIEKRI
jgi:hypothetical protein